MQLETFFDERTFTLSYVVFDGVTKDAVVVDPVLDYEPSGGRLWTESLQRVAAFVDAKKLTVHFVLETHPHADHLSGAQWLKQRYGAKVGISEHIADVQGVFKDVFALDQLPTDGRQFDVLVKDRQLLRAGALNVEAIATPGHTPACLSFKVDDAVFTGDALFLDDVGVGRCDFPKGDAAALYDSVTTRLFTLPDTTRLFVGHDYPPAGRTWRSMTTVGSAKESNVHLPVAMPKATFVEKRTARDRTLSPPRLLYPSVQVNINAGLLPEPKANGRRYLVAPLNGP
jgi:glyoxylase-like metal-dependent hydrolase (beta-lactamase superfamily II)